VHLGNVKKRPLGAPLSIDLELGILKGRRGSAQKKCNINIILREQRVKEKEPVKGAQDKHAASSRNRSRRRLTIKRRRSRSHKGTIFEPRKP